MARFRGAGRAITIILAIVLAGVATYAIWNYVQGLEEQAFEDAELVEVFVAQDEIAEGLSAGAAEEAGLIDRDTIPNRNVPDGAITTLEQIDGLVAGSDISRNEVIVEGRFVDPDEVAEAVLDIPEDFEALSVQVGIPPGVAGFIRPGHEVSLIATVESPELVDEEPDDPDDPDAEPEASELRTQYLLQNIQVLAVGQRVATEEGDDVEEGGGSVLLTVALEPEDAERLVFAIETASLYFTLLPDDAEPADTPGRTIDDLFD